MMNPAANVALSKNLTDRWGKLKTARLSWEAVWRDIAKFVMPRKAGMAEEGTQSPSTQRESALYDTTAVEACGTLANGQLSWMTPQASPWFAFEPADEVANVDDVKRWLGTCTERSRKSLASSNFYTSVHEFFMDRSAFGTAAMFVQRGKSGRLVFKNLPLGSFAIAEGEEGEVDTCFYSFKEAARVLVSRFGAENCSPVVRKAASHPSTDNEEFEVVHAIYPRADHERDCNCRDAENMPVASVYFETASGHVVQVGGFWEMPVMVSRYLVWSNGLGGVYGWSPAWAALPDARQVNHLQKMMDALAEKMAFPPVLAPANLEGEIDASAGGVTFYDPTKGPDGIKELTPLGRYDIGLQRIDEKQKSIRRHFHADLFKMFGELDRTNMTAAEVNARLREKVIQISPSFARLTTELLIPLLQRVFSLEVTDGKFPEPPQAAVVPVSATEGRVIPPTMHFTSRMEIELRSLTDTAFERTMQDVTVAAQFAPDVVDNLDIDQLVRDRAVTNGLKTSGVRPLAAVQQLREARAAAAAQAQQMQAAQQGAEIARKVGSIRADSPVGQAAKDLLSTQAA